MQLLSHLCVAASHWPIGIHRRHQATRPWPLTRIHGRTLSSMKCLWHIVCTAHVTLLCAVRLCVCCTAGCRGPCATTTTTTTTTITNITNIDNNNKNIDNNNKNSR